MRTAADIAARAVCLGVLTFRARFEGMIEESIAALFAGLTLVAALPAYDSRVDADELLRLLPFLSDSPFVTHHGMDPHEEWNVMATSVSRAPDADVARAAEIAGLWWWRAVSESLVRAGTLPRAR